MLELEASVLPKYFSSAQIKQSVRIYLTRAPRSIRADRRTFATLALDIWSAGIILLCLLTRRFPFFNSNDDTEALAEITAIFGKRKLEKCAALHSPSFSFFPPSLSF